MYPEKKNKFPSKSEYTVLYSTCTIILGKGISVNGLE